MKETYKFKVELELTKKELEVMLKITLGEYDPTIAEEVDNLINHCTSEKTTIQKVRGLGSIAEDFQEMFSYGLYVQSKQNDIELGLADRYHGNFHIGATVIKNIEIENVPNQKYTYGNEVIEITKAFNEYREKQIADAYEIYPDGYVSDGITIEERYDFNRTIIEFMRTNYPDTELSLHLRCRQHNDEMKSLNRRLALRSKVA